MMDPNGIHMILYNQKWQKMKKNPKMDIVVFYKLYGQIGCGLDATPSSVVSESQWWCTLGPAGNSGPQALMKGWAQSRKFSVNEYDLMSFSIYAMVCRRSEAIYFANCGCLWVQTHEDEKGGGFYPASSRSITRDTEKQKQNKDWTVLYTVNK